MGSKLIGYALDFSSFLVQKIRNKDRIRNIILFGSVARDEADGDSDVDLFVDIVSGDKKIEIELEKIRDDFLDSMKYKNYWKPLEIENEIKLTIGNLNEWKELKPSIIANGVLLYGKFKPEIKEGKHTVFFVWENISPNSKRVLFNKQLFGYKQNSKFYKGLLQKYEGERLGKGCVIVPLEQSKVFHKLFKKYRINVKIKKVLEY